MTVVTPPRDLAVAGMRWATAPPERRGTTRDGVRLMVVSRSSGQIEHRTFNDLPDYLRPGDAVVVNVSATLPAAVAALTEDGTSLRLHFASPVVQGLWSVEVRTPNRAGTTPGPDLEPQTLRLPGGVDAHLLTRHPTSPRLWIASVEGVPDVPAYLTTHGEPIRYAPDGTWPLSDYQTVFAVEPGSAEMPSAGRPFTPELVTTLVAGGVVVLPVVLHAGASSYEDDETPGEERFQVPATTARVANTLRTAGGRVIAVGTTVVRALETVSEPDGTLHPGRGITDLVVTPERGVRAVDGLLTGWHEPGASHLRLLEAVAGQETLERCYQAAFDNGYLRHEFGDELLILG